MIGEEIKTRRASLGWSQIELSEKSHVRQADVSRIENGGNFEIKTLLKILKVLKGEIQVYWDIK